MSRSDGSYALTVPGGGSYVLIAAADGHQPQAATVVVGEEPLSVELTLPGTSRLTGVVHSAATGSSIAGATVAVTDARGEIVGSTTTDQRGLFSIQDLVSGTFTVVVSASGHRPSALPIEIGNHGTTRCDVELQVSGRLRGTVRAGSANRPLEDARVALVNAAGNVVAVTTTGPNGEYAFTDLDMGEYTVTASAYPPATTTTTIERSEQVEFDLMLSHPDE
jgi:uncharacterized surface anchored protein